MTRSVRAAGSHKHKATKVEHAHKAKGVHAGHHAAHHGAKGRKK